MVEYVPRQPGQAANTPAWWRHQMETFSALLAIYAGNSTVPGEFPAQRPVTRSFDVFVNLRPNKRLSKQWWGWWFETPSCSLWRHCNESVGFCGTSTIVLFVTPNHRLKSEILISPHEFFLRVLAHRQLKFNRKHPHITRCYPLNDSTQLATTHSTGDTTVLL